MSTINKEQLEEILRKHAEWLQNSSKGSKANLSGADLFGADLYRANLSGANLYRANLSGANLFGANLYRADLFGANLYRANLSGADLSGANLSGADLSGANLSGANLYRANLSGADLFGADFSRANLSGADLFGADFSRANLSGTIYKSNPKQEFQFQRHIAVYFGTNEIRIGCKVFSIRAWVDNFKRIGKEENYSDEQIEKYGAFINYCAEDFARIKNESN